jgi:hypothetical protein
LLATPGLFLHGAPLAAPLDSLPAFPGPGPLQVPASNDDFLDAEEVSGSTTQKLVDMVDATSELGEPEQRIASSVWYYVTLTEAKLVTVRDSGPWPASLAHYCFQSSHE